MRLTVSAALDRPGTIGPRGRGKVDFDLPYLRELLPKCLD